jgi:putative hydrolase of HD superfamily
VAVVVTDPELAALLHALALTDEERTGWALRGVSDPESVADHTWGVCLLCLFYGDRAGVDVDRALRMAVLHDLGEAETGDYATRADPAADTIDPERKEREERAAIEELLDPFDSDDRFRDLWEEYEARETPTAQFVTDMDLVNMCLQAVRYERGSRYDPEAGERFEAFDDLDEFFATAEPRIRTEVGRDLYERTKERYERAKTGD